MSNVRFLCAFVLLLASLAAAAQQSAPAGPASPGGATSAAEQTPEARRLTSAERRLAEREFRQAVKLAESDRPREAFEHFNAAIDLVPGNVAYLTARESARQQVVRQDLQQGNQALADGDRVRALGLFREALSLDPGNDFARQRMRDALPHSAGTGEPIELAGPVELRPAAGERSFHLRGNSRDILSQVTLAYGITAQFDDSFPNRTVRFDLEQANWAQAMLAITRVTKSLWTPLSAQQALFFSDTQENRLNLQMSASATYYVPQAATPQDLNDLTGVMRTLFEVRFVHVNTKDNSITVRADARVLEAIGQFLRGLADTRPEVTFDVHVFQVSRNYVRAIGLNVPTQFQLFNIPSEVRSILGNSATQTLLNQLSTSGLTSSLISQIAAALVAQGGTGGSSPLLTQPFAIFGGGLTLSALSFGGTSLNFSRDHGIVRTLDTITLRASQGTPAVLKIGQRYPILTGQFSSILSNTSSGSSSLSGLASSLGVNVSSLTSALSKNYQTPLPSFNYEDLGFVLKATPVIHRDNSVGIKIELQLRSLGTQTVNSIPIINNREFSGYISAPDGETVVAAVNLSQSDARIMQGWPIPPFKNQSAQQNDDEMMVVITPHVVTAYPRAAAAVPLPNTMAK